MSIEGRRIGPYQVGRRLGVGGMAEVYVADRLGPGGFRRAVALKVLRPHLRDAAGVSERFVHEALLASRLRHPNVVPVVELSTVDGLTLIEMDLVDGLDLRAASAAAARRGRPLPAWLAVHVALQVARGLAYAHRFPGLVHCDVSPQNILLSRTGEVRLADFGIARALGRLEESAAPGALRGKLAYLAPELVAGGRPDARSDLFGLGVVLWETLSGRRLFLGASDAETLARVRRCEVTIPPPGAEADVPARLWAALGRALDVDPAARTPGAEAFAAALAAAWPAADRGEATLALAAWVESLAGAAGGSDRPADSALRPPAAEPDEAVARTLTPTAIQRGAPPWRLVARRLVLPAAALMGVAGAGAWHAFTVPAERAPAVEPVAPRVEAAPARRRPPPAARASLVVTTRPAGADIEVNGRPAGRTPRRLDGLPDGEPVVVVLRLDGHRPVERTVTPTAGAAPLVDVSMQPAFGLLSLDAEPWAEVALDGEPFGATPILARRVPAGRRAVRLVHPPSGLALDLTLEVGADQHVRRRVSLRSPGGAGSPAP